MSPGTGLLDFPPELLVRIGDNLTSPELGQFRRSCKQIEASLFDSFANEFFSKRQFMVEHWSLEALVGIANHPTLSSRLTEVLISTHRIESTDPDIDRKLFLGGYMRRSVLLSSGESYRMLVEVFTKLPNLKVVGLRDFDGIGRDRDGPDARWRSWGWSKYAGHIVNDSPDSLFTILIAALAAAKASPTNLEVMFRSRTYLGPDAFAMPRGISTLADLKTLFLAVSAPSEWSRIMAPGQKYDPARNVVAAPLQRFLHNAPGLETLRLNFGASHYFGYRFLEWFATTASSSAALDTTSLPVPALQLGRLKCLDIGMCIATATALIGILTKHNLESFSLWKVTIHGSDSSLDHWSEMLATLSHSLPSPSSIRSVKIGWSAQGQQQHHSMAAAVSFVSEDADLTKKSSATKVNDVAFQAKYTAKSVHQWLEELAARTFTPHIHDPDIQVDSEESDSEQDSNDGDDDVIDLVSDDGEDESGDE